MSKVCAICGKGKMSGNLVSHSNRKTPRTYSANLKKVKVEINGKETPRYVCPRCKKPQTKKTDNQNKACKSLFLLPQNKECV